MSDLLGSMGTPDNCRAGEANEVVSGISLISVANVSLGVGNNSGAGHWWGKGIVQLETGMRFPPKHGGTKAPPLTSVAAERLSYAGPSIDIILELLVTGVEGNDSVDAAASTVSREVQA